MNSFQSAAHHSSRICQHPTPLIHLKTNESANALVKNTVSVIRACLYIASHFLFQKLFPRRQNISVRSKSRKHLSQDQSTTYTFTFLNTNVFISFLTLPLSLDFSYRSKSIQSRAHQRNTYHRICQHPLPLLDLILACSYSSSHLLFLWIFLTAKESIQSAVIHCSRVCQHPIFSLE